MNYKDIAVRAGKTFIQAFVATWVVTQDPFTKASVIAAAAAGVSAIWNSIVQYKNQ